MNVNKKREEFLRFARDLAISVGKSYEPFSYYLTTHGPDAQFRLAVDALFSYAEEIGIELDEGYRQYNSFSVYIASALKADVSKKSSDIIHSFARNLGIEKTDIRNLPFEVYRKTNEIIVDAANEVGVEIKFGPWKEYILPQTSQPLSKRILKRSLNKIPMRQLKEYATSFNINPKDKTKAKITDKIFEKMPLMKPVIMPRLIKFIKPINHLSGIIVWGKYLTEELMIDTTLDEFIK